MVCRMSSFVRNAPFAEHSPPVPFHEVVLSVQCPNTRLLREVVYSEKSGRESLFRENAEDRGPAPSVDAWRARRAKRWRGIMLQRFLSFTSTALLCLGSSTAFAQTDPSGTDTRLDEAPTLEEHRTAADTRRPLQSADRADADRLPRVAKITFDHPFGADQTLASFSSSRTYSFDRTGRLHVVDMQTGEALGSTLL